MNYNYCATGNILFIAAFKMKLTSFKKCCLAKSITKNSGIWDWCLFIYIWVYVFIDGIMRVKNYYRTSSKRISKYDYCLSQPTLDPKITWLQNPAKRLDSGLTFLGQLLFQNIFFEISRLGPQPLLIINRILWDITWELT